MATKVTELVEGYLSTLAENSQKQQWINKRQQSIYSKGLEPRKVMSRIVSS